MEEKIFYTYIATNRWNRVLYTGMTNDIARRMEEHKNGLSGGFSKKCNICKLLYVEIHDTAYAAITREKQIKGGSRKKKTMLIESKNSNWRDISYEIH